MDRIRNKPRIPGLEWIHDLSVGRVAESLYFRGFRLDLLSLKPTQARHGERYRYRLLAFDPFDTRPLLSIDLEVDILGEYLLSAQMGGEREILVRYDRPPDYDSFRAEALRRAEERLSRLKPHRFPADHQLEGMGRA